MFSSRAFLPSMAAAFLVFAFVAPMVCAADAPTREIWKAGDMTVVAIQDLPHEMPVTIFTGPAPAEEKAKYFKNGKSEAGVNVFLLLTKDKIGLFDTGAGSSMFPSPGKLPDALAALGIKPEDVDFILITHMHGDHVGGLLRENARVFPKAKVYISKPEFESWIALAEKTSATDNNLGAGTARLAKIVATAYGADIQTFAFGDSPLPGVTALDASGHTPGHTVYQLTAEGKNLLIVGDIIHSMALQFPLPDECASFDMDIPKAVEARKRIFALSQENKMQIAGMHFPFGNVVGSAKKAGKGWKFERAKAK